MEPKVSIIIPTYKRSDKIVRAVKSALAQNYSNFEVIIVDDNEPTSIDRVKTRDNLKPFLKNEKFIYIEHEMNKNGSAARNTGIKHSTGEYITFLDDDDEYYPNKIKEQVNCLINLSDQWAICYSGYEKIEKNGKISISNESAEGDVLIQALGKNLFIGSGSNFMVKKNVIIEMNGFDESFMRNQDLEFLVRVVSKYKMKFIDKKLFLIHVDQNNNRFDYEQIVEVYSQYRITFQKFIERLSVEDKVQVEKLLDLSDIRLAFTYRKFREVGYIYKNSKLNLFDLLNYCKYLVTRVLTNKSYGFRL